MTPGKALQSITACALIGSAVLAEDATDDLEQEKMKAAEMTKAMQRAQLLLGDMSAIFECDYTGYDVSPREKGNKTTYLVLVDVGDNACTDMVIALNEQGAKDDLVFISERKLPEMNPMPASEPGPFEEQMNPPMDYTLINEVDPSNEQ